jgi:AcrR family transcriptional regulator
MAMQKRANKSNATLRARPQQKRGELRVDLILDAVEKILIEEGISGLTLTAVASCSGSAVGSMYRFFSNREQIIEAVVTRLRTSLEKDWAEQMPSKPNSGEIAVFVHWYTANFRQIVERHPVFPVVVRHLSEHCQPLEQLAMQPLDEFLSLNATAMPQTKRAVACRLMLAMATDSLQMCGKLGATTQKHIWEGLRNALSLLLTGYISQHRCS